MNVYVTTANKLIKYLNITLNHYYSSTRYKHFIRALSCLMSI